MKVRKKRKERNERDATKGRNKWKEKQDKVHGSMRILGSVWLINLAQPDGFRGAHGVREACGSVMLVAFVELTQLMRFVRSVARRISGLAAMTAEQNKTKQSEAQQSTMKPSRAKHS